MKHIAALLPLGLGSRFITWGYVQPKLRSSLLPFTGLFERAFDLFPQKCSHDRWRNVRGSIENNHKDASEIAGKHEKTPTHVGRKTTCAYTRGEGVYSNVQSHNVTKQAVRQIDTALTSIRQDVRTQRKLMWPTMRGVECQ